MNELSNQSLSHIVNTDHRTASIFEKYQLDFCCKGKRSLQEACEEKELPLAQIVEELKLLTTSNRASVTDHAKATLSQLIDNIVTTHHDYIRRESPQLIVYLQKIVFKHGSRYPEMRKVLETFGDLAKELEEHMKKEEQILFPRIKILDKQASEHNQLRANLSYLQSPIWIMEDEHDHAAEMLQEIRKLTSNYAIPPDACTTFKMCLAGLQAFESDLHQHVHLENNVLFPKAIQLIKQNWREPSN